MKSVITFIFVLMMAVTVSAKKANLLPEPQVTQINHRVYALLGPAELPNKNNRGYMVNTTVIIGDDGVILIDTGFTDEIGQHIKTAIAGLTEKPVTHVINTHDHGDHSLGNSAFMPVEIISSEKCQAEIEASGYEWIATVEEMTGLRFPHTVPVKPTSSYSENTKTSVTINGVELVIWVPPGSHTSNDLMVYLPEDGVLVAGDVLVNTMMPSFQHANIKNWLSTLQAIGEMQLSIIVPGHGRLMTGDDAGVMYLEMKKLYAAIESGYKNDLVISEIRATLDLTYWKQLNYFNEMMGRNISLTYLKIENENF